MTYRLNTSAERVIYARQAGAVRRCHTTRHLGTYDVAQHSYNMAMMLRILRPDAPPCLIWAVLKHDQPERLTGDSPAPAKWMGYLTPDYETVETAILEGVGLDHPPLSAEDEKWLKGLDLLELYVFAREQQAMGVSQFRQMRETCVRVLSERVGKNLVPAEIFRLMTELERMEELCIPEWGL